MSEDESINRIYDTDFSYDLIAIARYEGVAANEKNYGELVAIK